MANAGSSSDIVQTIGGDRRSRVAAFMEQARKRRVAREQASRKIAGWLFRRIAYHRTRFEFVHEHQASKLYTLEQDETDGTWHQFQASGYPDYDYEKEAWYDFLDWMSKYPTSYERTYNRTQILKEDLMAAAWHPKRVMKWLEQGEEILDMLCGV